jgi:hypothetical protein
MASVLAVHSVGNSLVRFLDLSFPGRFGDTEVECAFRLVSSGEMTAAATQDLNNTLTLYLYRVTVDEHFRNAAPGNGNAPLPLDLHFLLTVWSNSAVNEQSVIAWAMRQFHYNAILDLSLLSEEGGWRPGDTVQLMPAELSNEDMMRIWDALEPPYRLSVSYIARVVRIDPDGPQPDALPAAAMRFSSNHRREDNQ